MYQTYAAVLFVALVILAPSYALAKPDSKNVAHVLGIENTTQAVDRERWHLPEEPVPSDFLKKNMSYHPIISYQYALEQFDEHKKQSAAYWMYFGELRYRVVIQCKNLKPFDLEYDAYIALHHDIGETINVWLGGDVQMWVDTLHAVKSAYETQDDSFARTPQCNDARQEVLSGLDAFQDNLIENYVVIRQQRSENGYENRTTGSVTDPRRAANN